MEDNGQQDTTHPSDEDFGPAGAPADSRLVSFGWDAVVAAAFMEAAQTTHDAVVAGRITAQHRGRYRVATEHGDVTAIRRRRVRHDRAGGRSPSPTIDDGRSASPTVGDWVVLGGGDPAPIRAILPRRTLLSRKRPGVDRPQAIAANIDTVLIAAALDEPVNARRLERYAALAWESGAVPAVVLTKSDLCSDVEGGLGEARAAVPGSPVVAVSAAAHRGMPALEQLLGDRRTAVVVGQSGTGKSTLINALLGEARLRTAAVRDDGRGRHTTTHRELFRLPGGALLIDTPGLREVGMWDAADGVHTTFDDLVELAAACRFRDCAHRGEPGCAVQAAVDAGAVAADRVDAWHRLNRELERIERQRDPAAVAEDRARARRFQRAVREALERKRGR